jgi:UDP-2-acetamido-2,6-beta-L-arabino-hexul-4-ose reductase
MYPLNKNDTGSFQELAHKSDGIEFGQLSLLTVAPRCSRGGHYHTRKKEWFCCLHGSCYIACTDTRAGKQRIIVLNEKSREFVPIAPYENHSVLNPSNKECELLVICNEEYDPENPDTIKWERKGK